MAELSKQQQKNWQTAQGNVDRLWIQWLAAYDQARAGMGSVVLADGTPLKLLYEELQAARAKRNSLLTRYRGLGVDL